MTTPKSGFKTTEAMGTLGGGAVLMELAQKMDTGMGEMGCALGIAVSNHVLQQLLILGTVLRCVAVGDNIKGVLLEHAREVPLTQITNRTPASCRGVLDMDVKLLAQRTCLLGYTFLPRHQLLGSWTHLS